MSHDVLNEQSMRSREAAAAHRERVADMNAKALSETRQRMAELERAGLERAARRLQQNNSGNAISGDRGVARTDALAGASARANEAGGR